MSRIFLLAGVAVLCVSGTSSAIVPVISGSALKSAYSQHHLVLAELHKAHALLIKADHDYDGHRAKAAHEVTQAIHHLTGHTGTATTGTTKTGTTPKGNKTTPTTSTGKGATHKIPQAESDAHLREASTILTKALSQLHSSHAASAKIQAAITEIHTALKIK